MWRVLCVDDDRSKAAEISEYLTAWKKDNPWEGFEAEIETDFERSLERLTKERFDLVTLDLHGAKDPDPVKGQPDGREQEGKNLLDELRKRRFVPVIFYSGFAEKIASLETGIVRVVKKGSNDLENVRAAAKGIFETGLPRLVRHIENEQRTYIWDTIDRQWDTMKGDKEQLSYLLARRLAARFNHDSIKEHLGHRTGVARPIEHYIYPAVDQKAHTGNIYRSPDGGFSILSTPACDLAQNKADRVLLVRGKPLTEDSRHQEWSKTKWKGTGTAPSPDAKSSWSRLESLIKNKAGERYRFLPGTKFLPDLVVDLQDMVHVELPHLATLTLVCQLDIPFRHEFMLHLSRYYGRLGTPDLETDGVVQAL